MAVRGSSEKGAHRGEGFKLYKADEDDEDDGEEEERIDEIDQEDINDDIGEVEEDEGDDEYNDQNLLYERETPDGMILQVIHAPSGDPDSVFFVRQRTQDGECVMNLSINI